MSTKPKDSAHPEIFTDTTGKMPDTYSSGGLTKREYFAAQALQGALAASVGGGFKAIDHEYYTEHAVKFADALIKALNQSTGE